jgi:5-methyltetrahydropteroyltriglutamate--homocysteine methyltransferase
MPRCSPARHRKKLASISSRTAKSGGRATRSASPLRSRVDIDNPGVALDRSGHPNPVPRIVGRIKRKHAVQVEDLKFLKRHTSRKVKITVPGPFTMSQQAENVFYADEAEAAMDYAVAVNAEIRDLFAAGADYVQIDEPYLQARPERARQYGLRALNRALEGIAQPTVVHICFGYAAIIHQRPTGYSFLSEMAACTCSQISLETAQSHLDCSVLDAKMRSMVEGAAILRAEYGDVDQKSLS